jgi:hypothetical protein
MRRFLFLTVAGVVAISVLRAHCADGRRRAELAEARARAHQAWLARHDRDRVFVREVHPRARESVGDIPVPIVPGTRVTEAEIRPPQPPAPPRPPKAPRVPRVSFRASRAVGANPVVTGRLSATEQRARDDARLQLDRVVAEWLEPEVPRSWKAPKRLVDALVLENRVKPVEKDLGTLFEATIRADLSPARRNEIAETYHRELVARRLALLGGVLAFVLTCLAALAGYIKADEATKGYYTNRLRVAAAAGVGASGVLIYQMLT